MEFSCDRKRSAEVISSSGVNGDPTKKPRCMLNLPAELEVCYSRRCICTIELNDVYEYLDKFTHSDVKSLNSNGDEPLLLLISWLSWLGHCCHEQLVAGRICPTIQAAVNRLLPNSGKAVLFKLLSIIKASRGYLRYTSCRAVSALLPLSFCGQHVSLDASENLLQAVLSEIDKSLSEENRGRLSLMGESSEASVGCLADLTAQEVVGLGGLDLEEELLPRSAPKPNLNPCVDDLDYQAALLSLLSNSVVHGGGGGEAGGGGRDDDTGQARAPCIKIQLEEDQLCQETQIKCLLLRLMEPVWNRLVDRILGLLATLSNLNTAESRLQYVLEGLRLWQSLISIRANINFVESRNFAGNLSACVHALQAETPGCVWRAVVDLVSECLCYGTTLGLQSVPPEEPCQLAHTIIRLVRFDNFLSRVPYKESLGFGGRQAANNSSSATQYDYDRGLVQKLILVLLKCVALTTREARVESSSGESDSSLSSRESGSSCSSDIIIIERNMVGMFKQLDSWMKCVLPVLPYSTLQHSVLHLLQEQDDLLIEGLLCLLDTHIALHVPAREPIDSLLDMNPTRGFMQLLNIVSRDSSVLLDFLVSNETCFLLYLLRYLKFVVKDWNGFVDACGEAYEDTVTTLMHLKSSIAKLTKKSLFPYNISPVLRLLERIHLLRLNKT